MRAGSSLLFAPLQLRSVTLRNRIMMSPMCMYSSTDGFANDWHLVHVGARAVGGVGLVMMEATAVQAVGRITPGDLGLWQDAHVESLRRVVSFVHEHGAAIGIQLAHAGRKGAIRRPWEGSQPLTPGDPDFYPVVAPSPQAFAPGHQVPRALTQEEIHEVVQAFAAAARRADEAGFDVVEIHAAHGYLLHEFLSPLTNLRSDEYGGGFAGRTRLLTEVVQAVRQTWPQTKPLLVRISAVDWLPGGWTVADSVSLARQLAALGVDLIDCSSGGIAPGEQIPLAPGYQVPFAAEIRKETGVATGAVGLITTRAQAADILAQGQADLIVLGRALLRDPYLPLQWAQEEGVSVSWPRQYLRAQGPRP